MQVPWYYYALLDFVDVHGSYLGKYHGDKNHLNHEIWSNLSLFHKLWNWNIKSQNFNFSSLFHSCANRKQYSFNKIWWEMRKLRTLKEKIPFFNKKTFWIWLKDDILCTNGTIEKNWNFVIQPCNFKVHGIG